MTPQEEAAYVEGRRSAFATLLTMAAIELDGPERDLARLLSERTHVTAALRRLCKDLDVDADWPDNLCLGDVIEKRIGRVLVEREEDRREAGEREP